MDEVDIKVMLDVIGTLRIEAYITCGIDYTRYSNAIKRMKIIVDKLNNNL